MKKNLYAIRDTKVGTWQPPMAFLNIAEACRSLAMIVNKAEHGNMLNMSPTDFQLWKVGEYDTMSGQITEIAPEHEINIVDLLESQQKPAADTPQVVPLNRTTRRANKKKARQ